MRKIFVITILCASSILTYADIPFEGLWCDESRKSPMNPTTFISISKLTDGRYVIVYNGHKKNHDPFWEVSIGIIEDNNILFTLSDGEWRLKYNKNKENIEFIVMKHTKNPDFEVGFGRANEQPMKKLEGSVRGETFTK